MILLTRFFRKLAAAQVNIPWPITTTQKASSEVQALIQEELPEDSSDEEYNPDHDKHTESDDDREMDNTTSYESQQSTSTNNRNIVYSEQQRSSDIRYDPEGIFKIPAYVCDIYMYIKYIYNTVTIYNTEIDLIIIKAFQFFLIIVH